MPKHKDAEDRRQQQLRRLGTQSPVCVSCGETDPVVMEKHHIAGRKHREDIAMVCRNCHSKLSDQQRDHVPSGRGEPEGVLAKIGHYLLGFADLLALAVNALREFGHLLIEAATRAVAS